MCWFAIPALPIQTRLGLELLFIDRKVCALCFENLAIAAVADQRLVALFELVAQGRDDGFPVGGILFGLLFVDTDDVAAILDHHRLDLSGAGLPLRAFRLYAPHNPSACQDSLTSCWLRMRAPRISGQFCFSSSAIVSRLIACPGRRPGRPVESQSVGSSVALPAEGLSRPSCCPGCPVHSRSAAHTRPLQHPLPSV